MSLAGLGRFVLFALCIRGHAGASSADDAPLRELEDTSAGDEPHALFLLQDVTSLNLLRNKALAGAQALPQAAAASLEDAASLAQTGVTVESAPATARTRVSIGSAPTVAWGSERPTSEEEVDASPAQQPVQPEGEDEEEASCSLQGLTPGICAMAALAKEAPEGEQAAGLDFLRPERLERALFKEIESALAGTHTGFSAANVTSLEGELASLYAALPKNEAGLLGAAAARYALHQRFLRRHAWYVRSLNPAGEAQTPASPGEMLRGRVPQHLLELLDRRGGGHGVGLRELAVLVATLEHLIQGDMGERLKAAYAAHGLSPRESAKAEDAGEVLKTFMTHFLSLQHRSGYAITPEQAQKEMRDIAEYDGWTHVVGFVRTAVVQQSSGSGLRQPLRFEGVLAAARDVMERFRAYSREECRGVKTSLSKLPGGASGRVRLSDFHQEAVDGTPIFGESTEFLAKLGALDRSDSGSDYVLMPNYVYSPSNCVGTTSFFDMCCPNDCEGILEDIEQSLQTPEATYGEISSVVEAPPPVLAELEEATRAGGGRIGLHGFAFAKWLHRAFPRDCPRPRARDFKGHAGHEAEVPDAAAEFQATVKVPMVATKAELLRELQHGNSSTATAFPSLGAAPWAAGGEPEAAAARAMGQAASGPKAAFGLDAASLAQTQLEVTAPAEGKPAAKSSLRREKAP